MSGPDPADGEPAEGAGSAELRAMSGHQQHVLAWIWPRTLSTSMQHGYSDAAAFTNPNLGKREASSKGVTPNQVGGRPRLGTVWHCLAFGWPVGRSTGNTVAHASVQAT